MAPTAVDEREHAEASRIEVLTTARSSRQPIGKMLISSPRELDAVIRRVPEGRVMTMSALLANLARAHQADYTCPITADAFLRIVAAAAEEERASRGGAIAPYWRVVQDDGALVESLPGGTAAQARRLVGEGVTVLFLGKTPRVTEVSHFAWTPPALGKHGLNAPGGRGDAARRRAPPRRRPRRPRYTRRDLRGARR